MKTREQRNREIEDLKVEFGQSANALVVGFQKLKVEDDEKLRRELRQANLKYRVIKNTLAVIASKGTAIEAISEKFVGPTAIALSPNDPVSLAKILSKWAKDSQAFTFKAGIVEGHVIEIKDIDALSNLPSKEELISKMMFVLNSGAQRLATVTAGVSRNLAVVLGQIRDQKESGVEGAASSEGVAPSAGPAEGSGEPVTEGA